MVVDVSGSEAVRQSIIPVFSRLWLACRIQSFRIVESKSLMTSSMRLGTHKWPVTTQTNKRVLRGRCANARSAVPQPSDANEVWIKDRGQAVMG